MSRLLVIGLPFIGLPFIGLPFIGLLFIGLLAAALSGCMAFHPDRLPDAPPEAAFAEIGDTHVHFIDRSPTDPAAANGRTVVLVHGFGSSTTEWLGVIPELTAAGFRAVALDLRGHGWSSRPDGDYSIDAQARLLLDLVARLGIDRFSLVGHSWGSAVALRVALDAGERVDRVALYNGMFFEDQQPVLFAWARAPGLGELIYGGIYPERQADKLAFAFYDPEAHITEDLVERLAEAMDRPGTLAAALAGVRAMDYSGLEAAYPSLRQPVLLLWGREDQVTPLEYGERLSNLLADARLVVLPQCGHLPMIEVPVASTAALMRFLTNVNELPVSAR